MMGMSVYDSDAAQRVALVLSKYLFYLSGSFEFQMDVSPKAVIKRSRNEVASLRSSTQSHEERVNNYTKKISGEHDRLSPPTVGHEQHGQQNKSMDLSAKALSKKYSTELAEMSTRLSLKDKMAMYNKKTELDKMYFTSGNVVTIKGVERDWNKIKTEEKGSAGDDSVDLDGVFDPLKLDERATTSLRQLLQAQLRITEDSSEQQVCDLLDYAMDMISSESSICTVVKEVSFNICVL